jgi:hypothetical protein
MVIEIDQGRHRWRARPLLSRGCAADPVYHRLCEDVTTALSLREDITVALSPALSSGRGHWIMLTVRPLQDLMVVAL